MHSYSQDLTGNISFLASCEGDKCLPRAGSAFTVDFFLAPVPEAAGGGADDVEASEEVEAAGRGADDVETAGGGAGGCRWRSRSAGDCRSRSRGAGGRCMSFQDISLENSHVGVGPGVCSNQVVNEFLGLQGFVLINQTHQTPPLTSPGLQFHTL